MLSLQELRSSTAKELGLELQGARREQLRIRMGIRTKHLKDTSLARKQKRYVAQILQVLAGMGRQSATTPQAAKKTSGTADDRAVPKTPQTAAEKF